jgi:hypothetical protein
MQSRLQIETKPGKPISIGKTRIVPYSQSLRVNFPQTNGGLIWNRPISVLVINADGDETVIPVPDVTRRLQIAIFGSGFLGMLLIWLITRSQRYLRR